MLGATQPALQARALSATRTTKRASTGSSERATGCILQKLS